MDKKSKIYVAGHGGLVGSSLLRRLKARGYDNFLCRTRQELDLIVQKDVDEFICEQRPEYIFLAAARVGGIYANNAFPADFIYENIMVQSNIIHSAYKYGVKKLLFLGSSCIYPRKSPQPIREEYLLTGELEPTNEAYALAKIAGIRMCKHYNQQYGCNFISAMPTNLYGPGDNYNLQNSHVLPALIRKFHEGKINGSEFVEVWGSGTPRREFLYVDDMADACIYLMENYDGKEFFNIGMGEDVSIGELAELVKEIVGFEGSLRFDTSKPDGMARKLLDVTKINEQGWKYSTSLREGIIKTYQEFLRNIG